MITGRVEGPSAELGGAGTPHWGRGQEGRLSLACGLLLVDPVGTLLARLLVDVVGVARHRRHGDLLRVKDDKGGGARRRRPIHRPVRVSAHRFLGDPNTWRICLVGGTIPPKVSTSTSRVMAFLTHFAS